MAGARPRARAAHRPVAGLRLHGPVRRRGARRDGLVAGGLARRRRDRARRGREPSGACRRRSCSGSVVLLVHAVAQLWPWISDLYAAVRVVGVARDRRRAPDLPRRALRAPHARPPRRVHRGDEPPLTAAIDCLYVRRARRVAYIQGKSIRGRRLGPSGRARPSGRRRSRSARGTHPFPRVPRLPPAVRSAGRRGALAGQEQPRDRAVMRGAGDRVDAVMNRMPQPHRVAEPARVRAPGRATARAAGRRRAAASSPSTISPARSRIPPATPSRTAHDVDARVDAVAQVDVEVAGLAPHRGVAGCRSHARVRPGIRRPTPVPRPWYASTSVSRTVTDSPPTVVARCAPSRRGATSTGSPARSARVAGRRPSLMRAAPGTTRSRTPRARRSRTPSAMLDHPGLEPLGQRQLIGVVRVRDGIGRDEHREVARARRHAGLQHGVRRGRLEQHAALRRRRPPATPCVPSVGSPAASSGDEVRMVVPSGSGVTVAECAEILVSGDERLLARIREVDDAQLLGALDDRLGRAARDAVDPDRRAQRRRALAARPGEQQRAVEREEQDAVGVGHEAPLRDARIGAVDGDLRRRGRRRRHPSARP